MGAPGGVWVGVPVGGLWDATNKSVSAKDLDQVSRFNLPSAARMLWISGRESVIVLLVDLDKNQHERRS